MAYGLGPDARLPGKMADSPASSVFTTVAVAAVAPVTSMRAFIDEKSTSNDDAPNATYTPFMLATPVRLHVIFKSLVVASNNCSRGWALRYCRTIYGTGSGKGQKLPASQPSRALRTVALRGRGLNDIALGP